MTRRPLTPHEWLIVVALFASLIAVFCAYEAGSREGRSTGHKQGYEAATAQIEKDILSHKDIHTANGRVRAAWARVEE